MAISSFAQFTFPAIDFSASAFVIFSQYSSRVLVAAAFIFTVPRPPAFFWAPVPSGLLPTAFLSRAKAISPPILVPSLHGFALFP